jgi:PAS domain S-box-containing protein
MGAMTDEAQVKEIRHELKEAKSDLKEAASELKGTENELKGAQSELKEAKSELKGATSELKGATSELKGATSELKGTKKELKQANIDIDELKEYQLFVNTVQEYGIFFLDIGGYITRWGLGAEKIYGYKAESVIGKYFSFLYTDEDVAAEWPGHNLKQADEQSIYEEVREKVRQGGEHFWANAVITPLRNAENGTLVGFAKIVKDISGQKALEEQLKQHHQELASTIRALEESNSDLELFATIAAHDLQVPLRKIENFSELVEKAEIDHLGQESLDYLRRARTSVQSMQALIRDLLQLAKISQEQIEIQVISLSQIVAQVLKILESPIREKKAEIQVGHLDDLEGDESQLTQLIQNLIDNALKFQEKGKKPIINISSKKIHEQYCEIQVQDNGIGFRLDQSKVIFENFKRLVGKSSYPGSGVGLAICQRIAERHCGNIAVNSKPGEGTTFIITLPLKRYSNRCSDSSEPDLF